MDGWVTLYTIITKLIVMLGDLLRSIFVVTKFH